MRNLAFASVSALLVLSACSEPVEQKLNDFNSVLESVSQSYFSQRPEIASIYGLSDQEAGTNALSSLSYYDPASELARRNELKSMIDRLANIDQAGLSEDQVLNIRLIETEMRGAYLPATVVDYGSVLGEYGNWFLTYSVSHLSGPHVEIQTVLEDSHPITNTSQADAFLTRLSAYGAVIDGLIEKVNHDQELGVIPPDFVLNNIIANLEGHIEGDAVNSTMVSAFYDKMIENNVSGADQYRARVIGLVEGVFVPATQRLINTLKAQLPDSVHTAGIHRLPNGAALYQALITHMTDTSMTAEEIHELGLNEVERIHLEMDALLKQIGLSEGGVGSRMQEMLNDPKYIYPNTDEGKAQLFADMKADLELANEKLPLWFGKLPDQDVVIRPVPAHRENSGSGAYYSAPSKDGTVPGTYWINLSNTAANPSYGLQSLTYHETNPGHHLQTLIGLSDTNHILGTVFYSNAAGEGWGLYAEKLAKDMGIYDNDPESDLGRLQWELHRAVRLVVDTGMHARGWSREQAINYSIGVEGIHIDDATAEIERYAVWPGQALGYKIGEMKIGELRERAREALGDKFDVRIFHDRILENGSLPLNVMEDKIDNWIAGQLNKK
jgi:uncharacterized protein (DUF885 family)